MGPLEGLIRRPESRMDLAQYVPDKLFSCRGQGQSDPRQAVEGGCSANAWIAKSLRCLRVLHLGGLCKPEPRNGVGLAAASVRPPSQFSSEMGSRQTRSRVQGFCASDWAGASGRDANGPKDLRGCQNECAGLGKEFRFADI